MNRESAADRLRVLILDDEAIIRDTFSIFLTRAGFEVVAVANMAAALAALTDGDFNVAVVDRILSKGESGLLFIQGLRPRQPYCETILISADPTFDSAQETIKLKSFAYIAKPVLPDELCFYVEEAAKESLAKKKAAENKELFHALFDVSPTPVAIINNAGRAAFLNTAFSEIFGYTLTDFKDTGKEELFVPESDRAQTQAEIRAVIAGKMVKERETIRLTKNGRVRKVSSTLFFYKIGKSSSGYVLFFLRDITLQKEMEKKLHEAEKLSLLGQLSAKVAHEINNPLQVIMGGLDLMLESSNLDETEKGNLALAIDGALIIRNLTRDLMSFARPFSLEISAFPPHTPIEKAINFMKSSGTIKTFKIVKEFQEDIPKLKGDFQQFQQVFMNLIINASHAMKDSLKKELYFRTDYDQAKKLVRMSVQDTGCGITEKDLVNVFDDFYTTRSEQGGTGLGLAVVKNIAEKHGGSVSVQSRDGTGAMFMLELPLNG
ncbi:MAG: PAS domain S-box protein [Deltaproteobacteria bacterium]|nr:PAS domain S-box protein [Deltaproteobacteria bacterium]